MQKPLEVQKYLGPTYRPSRHDVESRVRERYDVAQIGAAVWALARTVIAAIKL